MLCSSCCQAEQLSTPTPTADNNACIGSCFKPRGWCVADVFVFMCVYIFKALQGWRLLFAVRIFYVGLVHRVTHHTRDSASLGHSDGPCHGCADACACGAGRSGSFHSHIIADTGCWCRVHLTYSSGGTHKTTGPCLVCVCSVTIVAGLLWVGRWLWSCVGQQRHAALVGVRSALGCTEFGNRARVCAAAIDAISPRKPQCTFGQGRALCSTACTSAPQCARGQTVVVCSRRVVRACSCCPAGRSSCPAACICILVHWCTCQPASCIMCTPGTTACTCFCIAYIITAA